MTNCDRGMNSTGTSPLQKTIVWKTRVTQVEAFPYSNLNKALDQLEEAFGDSLDREQAYLDDKPNSGYCLGLHAEVIEKVFLPRPDGMRFSQQGWERDDRPEIASWLA